MRKARTIIAIVFSIFVVGYVLLTLDWNDVWETIRFIEAKWLLAALCFHLLTYLIRTFRFRYLLGSNPRFLSILGATNLYGMYLYLMPVKTGEVTLPLLYKDHLGIPLTHSTAALLISRFLDLVVMAFLLPVLLIIEWSQLQQSLRVVIVILSLVIFICWILLITLLRNPVKMDSFIKRLEESHLNIFKKTGNISKRIFVELHSIYSGKKLLPALLISSCIWIIVQCTLFCIISSLGIRVTLLQVVVVTLVMIPFTFVPLQGFANLGTYEISVVLAFGLFGVRPEESLNIAVGSHVVYIAFSLILGFLGVILLRISKLSNETI